MYYGGDYNPEQWPEEVWREDVRLMQEAGVNLVSINIFAWSRIQPEEGVFDFEWLDTVIDLLHAGGIGVDLATATASPPPWVTQAYPQILPQDENGATYWPGSRQHYAPTSPEYRRLAGELVTAIVRRYAAHPAVVLWHVNNELGCHLHYDYSDNARDAFQVWLSAKYGSIDVLNAAWNTAFWSQRYTAFQQVLPPRKAPYAQNPGAVLDFKRFTSDALLQLFTMERDLIRAAGATQPITTNFMGAFPAADYWRWAQEIDVISDDSYPDPNDPESFRAAAFTRDLMRSLKPDVPWLLMEQATNAVNWRHSNAPKAPGQMAALSAQAVGRGADGILFFQWRQSRAGGEKFHSAMLPHSGTSSRSWSEVTALGAELAALPALTGGSGARVALVFDWQNAWAISGAGMPVVLNYTALVQRWYAALHRQHIAVDIVHPQSTLDGYALVVAPQLYLLTDAGAENLSAFVEAGGHLLVSAFSDVVDDNDTFRPGGYLQGLGGTLGVMIEDFGALVAPAASGAGSSAGETGSAISGGGPGEDFALIDSPIGSLRGEYFAEMIHPVDAEVFGTFASGRMRGAPALTTRVSGQGRAHYLATIPDDDGMRSLTAWACTAAGVEALASGVDEYVELARRGDVLTVINHSTRDVAVAVRGVELGTGAVVDGVKLERYGWVMLRDA